jgi:Reverse transcriptase (RNA-dependent DNA polymerase)
MVLHMTIRNAKWEWVDRMIEDPKVSIWDLAKWRKGRHLQEIPPITDKSGLTHNPELMSSIFHSCFFNFLQDASTPPALIHWRNLDTRPQIPIGEDEISAALCYTSTTSAPGPSGIGYLLIRWVFKVRPGVFTLLFSHALSLGHHPWGNATIVIIPKPSKSNYMVAKAYCPISLLKCCGKTLEKVVAAHLVWEVDHASLISNRQFGSCHHYSAPDAALCLAYKARETIRHHHIGAVLLFDISRFFDHLSPELTATMLADLGVDPSMIKWIYSFMTDRTAQLSFNGYSSELFHPTCGTPQGSPLSPILSAIFTSPLLQESLNFNNADLTLYVDDGCIFTSGPTFISALAKVTDTFSLTLNFLTCMGLEIDGKKTEVMFFIPPRPSFNHGAQPQMVTIPCGNGKTLTIRLSTSLHYLRVFFTPKLDWRLHVTTTANRA